MQVNTSEESQKSGCAVEDAPALAKHIAGCSHLVLKGLMTIGKLDGDASEDFKTLVKCRATVAEALGKKEEELELSMGMSGDYEKAVSDTLPGPRVSEYVSFFPPVFSPCCLD